nr:hypothetical protein BACY1_12580 [Tenacibaculum mesophilum]
MAVQDIQNYSYQNIFSLQTVQFEESCVVNSPQQINQYKVFWIKEGTGKYNIDFKSYSFEDGVLFFYHQDKYFQ